MKTMFFISDPTEKLTIITTIVIDCNDKFASEIKPNIKEKVLHINKRISKQISERDKIHKTG